MEVLDEAMDSMYNRGVIGGEKNDRTSGSGNALDNFLGDLIPGGKADNVDSYLDDIFGVDTAADSETILAETVSSDDEADPLDALM